MIKVIVYIKANGVEGVHITQDTDVKAEDVIPVGAEVVSDEECDDCLPPDFPFDRNLEVC